MLWFAAFFRRRTSRPYVRPWALAVPILVLLICLPLLRPLRHPGQASQDEELRLATISSLVEHRHDSGLLAEKLAIDAATVMPSNHVFAVNNRIYSDQPPMLAFLLSGPYWFLRAIGYRMRENPILAPYLLTLLGSTLPAAATAGLVYRMARIFELKRPWRTALAAAVVFATGLISYAVVLNPHVPAAALVMGAAGCLVHLAASKTPSRGGGWIVISGLCAGLAATIDLSASIFLLLFIAVIPALRLPAALRVGGIVLFVFGAAPALLLHATLVVPLTGNLLPGSMHPELAIHRHFPFFDETTPPVDALPDSGFLNYEPNDIESDPQLDPQAPTLLQRIWRDSGKIAWTLLGEHGLLAHFPVVVLGVIGMLAVMHRHWPMTTKVMAASAAVAMLAGIVGFSFAPYGAATADFANRWLIVFLPFLLFWVGAWLRRPHHTITWWAAGVMLAFSVAVSLIGSTDPMPAGGYSRYTAESALRNLFNPPPPITQEALADR